MWYAGTQPATRRDTVLLLGTAGGGKTQIMSQLCYGRVPVDTVTSIRPNAGEAKGLEGAPQNRPGSNN